MAWPDLAELELSVCWVEDGKTKWSKYEKSGVKQSKKEVRNLLAELHNSESPDNSAVMEMKKIIQKITNTTIYEGQDEQTIIKDFKKFFPLFGLPTAFKKFQTKDPLATWEESAVIQFADRFVTVSTNEALIKTKTELPDTAAKVKEIVELCNTHKCTKACMKYGDGLCRCVFFTIVK